MKTADNFIFGGWTSVVELIQIEFPKNSKIARKIKWAIYYEPSHGPHFGGDVGIYSRSGNPTHDFDIFLSFWFFLSNSPKNIEKGDSLNYYLAGKRSSPLKTHFCI
ncbi:hypothetical protein M0811_10965 [Anaeramoeba ignava]|uniref:Uncharacterized protein n=1 Tax=Anaeramoeba ignava TaxID=1746090 RepID=A0A9Q0LFD7_ANAIG|nr:hypothetical protein M0811_10965 [Anaeramoeba ignava]